MLSKPSGAPGRVAVFYGLPNLTTALAMTPLVTFIPSFYAADFGMPLALVGTILFAARLMDMVSEPLTGILSDATRSRFGRRKPWIAVGVPLLMLGIWMVFAPPVKVTPAYAIFWIAVTFTAFNIVDNPYRAWGAELSRTYSGRTRIAGAREAFGLASSMLALALIFVLQRIGLGETRDMLMVLAIIFVAAMPILYGLSFWQVPTPPAEVLESRPASFVEGVRALFGNRAFLTLSLGLAVLLGGATIGASLHLIVMESVFDARDLFSVILVGENIAGLSSIPVWMWLAKRIGKHRALALGAAGMALLSAPIPLIPHDQPWLYAACIILRGAAGGALGLLVGSMLADVVDIDKVTTGRERTALYYGISGTIAKLGVALGILIGTVLPSMFGFEPSATDHSSRELFMLMVTYAWIPMVIMACATPFFWFYPLTEARQVALRSEIEARLSQTPVAP
jgi:Na+/melibiose symporter-like transporter